MKHPSKIVKVGDLVSVRILELNGGQRRISLSLRQTLPDPWTTIDQRYSPGQMVDGRVRNLTDFGAFVEIEDGVDALIHISDLSWSRNIKHPSEVLKKGQKVQGQILSLDPSKRRISLGLKQLKQDIWGDFCSRIQPGATITGRVVRIAQFGAFVEVEEGIEALCHNSEIDAAHTASGASPLEVGQVYDFLALHLDPEEKRISLSLKDVVQQSAGPRESAARGSNGQDGPDRANETNETNAEEGGVAASSAAAASATGSEQHAAAVTHSAEAEP